MKIELGQFEQSFKISETDVSGLGEVESMITDELLSNSLKRFVEMRTDWSNGFNVKKEFGSNSTSIKEGFGGLNGNKLKNNDILKMQESLFFVKRRWKEEFVPKYEKELTLRVILSYQCDDFKK